MNIIRVNKLNNLIIKINYLIIMTSSVHLLKKSTKHFLISEMQITSKTLGQKIGIYFIKWSLIQRGTVKDTLQVKLLGNTVIFLVVIRNL